ncbi:unnamed protein product, partial [Ilex paraguariensis]
LGTQERVLRCELLRRAGGAAALVWHIGEASTLVGLAREVAAGRKIGCCSSWARRNGIDGVAPMALGAAGGGSMVLGTTGWASMALGAAGRASMALGTSEGATMALGAGGGAQMAIDRMFHASGGSSEVPMAVDTTAEALIP